MRKLFAVAASLYIFPAISFAQTLPATKPPGGLDSTTVIPKVYADGTAGTLSQIGQMADGSVQQTEKNQPNGISGLDSNKNAVADVANAKILTGKLSLPVPDAVLGRNYKASFFDSLGDGSTSPDSVIFGGHQTSDSVFMKIIGGTYSHGDNGGVMLSVMDTGTSTFGSRNGAGSDDSIVIFPKAQDQSPRLSVGQDITDPTDNVAHTVTYGVSSVTITPALPASEIALIKPRMRLYSNYKHGNSPGDLSTHHALISPYLYYGYVNAVTSSASSTTITVLSDPDNGTPGWYINGSTASAAPGANDGDTIDNTSDSTSAAPGIIFSYPNPALFIGMSNKKFLLNPMMQFTGAKDSVTRAGVAAENDQLLPENMKDYQYQITGNSINPNTHGHRLTDDSVDEYLGGTGMPTLLRLAGGAEGTEIKGANIYAGPKGFGTPDTSTNPQAQGFAQVIGRFGKYTGVNQDNASTTGLYHTLSVYQQRMTDNSDGTHVNPSDVALIIQEGFGASQPDYYGNGGLDGAQQAKIRMWGGAVSLCAYGQGVTTSTSVDATKCGLTLSQSALDVYNTISVYSNQWLYNGNSLYLCVGDVGSVCHNFYPTQDGVSLSGQFNADTYGPVNSTGNMATGPGKALILTAPNGSSATYLTGDANGNAHLSGAILLPQGTPATSSSPCTTGQMQIDSDYIYSCVATNTWHRASNGATW